MRFDNHTPTEERTQPIETDLPQPNPTISQPLKKSYQTKAKKNPAPEPGAKEALPVIPAQKRHIIVRRMPGLSTKDEVRPYLAFGGLFLKKFGFYLGKKLTISMEPNKITIVVDEPGEGTQEVAREESAKRSIFAMREIEYRLMLTQNYLTDSKNGEPGK